MGHHTNKNPRSASLGLDAVNQHAVDEYKARSVWSAWWQLGVKVRRRFFTKYKRDFVTRYGARLD